MTTAMKEMRRGRALQLFMIAGALAVIAAITTAIDARSSRPDLASGPVVPGLEETIADAERITVTSTEASYRLERIERGQERVWVMRDRGDFPVVNERVERLLTGLQRLRRVRRMTSDATKHERLGVGDPGAEGRGIAIQVEDGRGALLVNLILGVEPDGGLYVRRPNEDQTYAAAGELPPLRDVSTWLDLRPLDLAPERLARVEIMPAEGRAYILARDTAEAAWRIATPALAPSSQTLVAATAERVARLSPVDVQAAPAVQGPARARLRATTFDGVQVDAELIETDGRTWLKLVARAPSPEQEAAALDINNRASAWAYALSAADAQEFAPPLATLIGAR
jgi:hypothetical protein